MNTPLRDGWGRVHRSLRLSVTDRCNFRCPYCMPEGLVQFQPRKEILTYEELEKLVWIGTRLGIEEVRITGGEPLIRKDLATLVRRLAAIDAIRDLSLTTNAYYLRSQAVSLKKAGLQRINISLDTLRRDRFQELARFDGLPQVLDGVEAAREAGFAPLKVNAVLVRGVNEDEVLELVSWARERNISFRFIELMPIGGGPVHGSSYLVPGREVKARIESRYRLVPKPERESSATARTYRFADGPGEVGFINPVTEPFCARCDRVRITADGKIRNCLFDEGELDLREPLRAGATVERLEEVWRQSVRRKGPGGCLNLDPYAGTGPSRKMWQIGG